MSLEKDTKIYIAGHTGLVGSAILLRLKDMGCKNILTRTHREMDLMDRKKAEKFFAKVRPEYVFLAAARVGGIHANSTYPAEFIYENLIIQTNIIDISYRYGVKKLLFLAGSCIYPKKCRQPMKEEYLMTGPLEPTNEPFGIAKIAGIKMCQAYNSQYRTNFISAIPANIYGIGDSFDETGHVISALMKRFHDAKIAGSKSVTVWGSGKPQREFIYVDDVADACIYLMKKYSGNYPINIGTGIDKSIKELANLIKDVTGFKEQIIYDMTRPDGMPRKLLDSSRITKLGWKPKTELKEGLRLTYEWYEKL